ncbi:hypothetical protein KDL01_29505 [Actinospica durhamensis]|uniref:LamG-like jellyroll fold domain-containing protein n=1 Tax=Actinospica durhamensis TaxID=1508375 RepID=A0A941ESV3_9ACTN|nr:LamG-like jellyroll fold domain-containing protein [Actinospica durhamensis]MBR7837452.1 hypothetical protein [Actinospica durhamensis]
MVAAFSVMIGVATDTQPPEKLAAGGGASRDVASAWHSLASTFDATVGLLLPNEPDGKTVRSTSDKAGKGTGHAPGKGVGQLPEYNPDALANRVAPGKSATIQTGYNAKTSKVDQKRTTSVNTWYDNADGSLTEHLSQSPSNYKNAAGQWTPINDKLTTSGSWYTNSANSFSLSLAASAPSSGKTATSVSGAADRRIVDPSADPKDATDGSTGELADLGLGTNESFGWSLAGAADVAGTTSADGTTVTYPSILADTDLQLTSESYGVKESLTLRSASAANVWTFPLSLKGVSLGQNADGIWQLTDGSGAVVATLEAPYADDSAGTRSDPEPAETHAVGYSLVQASDGTQDLVMTLDKSWLDDPARVFPVTVDPTTTVSINGQEETTYIDTGYPTANNGSSQRMVIGADPGNTADQRRSYLYFPTSSMVGQGWHVTGAQFAAYMYAASNTASSYASYTVDAPGSAWSVTGLTPNNEPTSVSLVGSGTYSTTTTGSVTEDTTVYDGSWTYLSLGTTDFNDWQWSSNVKYYGLELAATSQTDSNYAKWFTSSLYSGYAPYLSLTYTTDVAADVTAWSPSSGEAVQSLTPTLSVQATDTDPFPSAVLGYTFCVYSGTTGKKIVCSAGGTSNSYMVPAKLLKWGQNYQWIALVYDGFQDSAQNFYSFTTTAPPPVLGGQQSSDTSGKGFNAATGDYTSAATDASIATAGPELSVQRSYNSLNQLSSGAFGSGWSTGIDAGVTQVLDGAGNLTEAVVTYPDGEEIAFGRESDGTYDAPAGRYATLTYSSSTGYTLLDRQNTQYQFGHVVTAPVISTTDSTKQTTAGVYGITQVSDAQGRELKYSWSATTGGDVSKEASATSGRYLGFTWNKPAGAAYSHVTSVGEYSAAGTLVDSWNYGYTDNNDDLTSVCAPGETTACTGYTYKAGSVYQETIVNSGAAQYWPLDETSGTSAPTQVAANYGSGTLTYTGVGLGSTATHVAGSQAKVATFNGTSAYASSTASVVDTDGDFTVSAWAQVNTTSGVQDVVTEDGVHNSSFFLQLISDHWSFSRIAADATTGGTAIRASDPAAESANTWYFLTGTYVASTGALSIYVNGALVGTPVADTSPFYSASGALRIGRGFYAGSATDWYNGAISDVAVWGTSLSAMQISQLYAAGNGASRLLTNITRPNLQTNVHEADDADATYDPVTGRVSSVTDANGAQYVVSAPSVGYSAQAYQADVAAYAPTFDWSLGDGAPATLVTNSVTDETTSDGTGLDGTNEQAHYNAVTLGTDGSEFNGATSGTPTYTAGKFNGSSSYVTLPSDFLNELTTGSVVLWFKTSTAGGVILSSSAGTLDPAGAVTTTPGNYTPMLYVGSDGKLHGSFYSQPGYQYTSTSTVDDNTWHMVVLTAGQPSRTPKGVQVCPSAEATVAPAPSSATAGSSASASPSPTPSPCPDPSASTASASPSASSTPYSESMYVDGTAASTSLDPTLAAQPGQTNAYLGGGFIGGNWPNEAHQSSTSNVGTSQGFNGDMADVALYHSALSDSAVSQLWNAYKQVALGNVHYLNAIDKVTVTTPADSYDQNVTHSSTAPVATYYYDPANGMREAASQDPMGAMTTYGYDSAGTLDTVVDPNGDETITGHDDRGNDVSDTTCQDQVEQKCSTSYKTYYFDPVDELDPRNDVMATSSTANSSSATDTTYRTTYAYDTYGNLLSTTDPLGNTTSSTYTDGTGAFPSCDGGTAKPAPVGLQATSITAAGAVTRYTYYADGDVCAVSNGDGDVTTFTYDGLGRISSKTTGHQLVGDWPLTDPAGSTSTLDTSGLGNSGAVTNATFNSSYASFPGTAGQGIATPNPVLNTAGSYSISAWVQLTSAPSTYAMVASIKGSTSANQASAHLMYTTYSGQNRFIFQTSATASSAPTWYSVEATSSPTVGSWYHLVATHDGSTGQIALYINGTLVGTSVAAQSWAPSAGSFDIGSENGSSPFPGDIANVQAYQRALSATEVSTLYAQGRTGAVVSDPLTAAWPLTDAAGSTSAHDATGLGNPAMATGATFNGSYASFAGTSGQGIETANPVLNTSGSYSISAWVQLTSSPSTYAMVAEIKGLAGTSGAANILYTTYDGSNRFIFQTTATQSSSPTWYTAQPNSGPAVGAWYHLVGTRDASTGQISFYINGALVGTASAPSSWTPTTGDFVIGSDNGTSPFPGNIANVQAYQSALSATEVSALYAQGRTAAQLPPVSGMNETTSYLYDTHGQLAQVTNPPVTDAVTGATHTAVTSYTYDDDGDVLSTTVADWGGADASRETTDIYNNYDQVLSQTAPEGNPSYTYDASGNLLASFPADQDGVNHTSTFTYDAYGNAETLTDAAGRETETLYDGAGRKRIVELLNTDEHGQAAPGTNLIQETWTYDPAGRIAQTVQDPGGVNRTTNYTYYDNGLSYQVTESDGNGHSYVDSTSSYDGAGELTTQFTQNGALETDYKYDFGGEKTTTTVDPSGVDRVTTDTYGPDGQVDESTVVGYVQGSTGTRLTVSDNKATFDALGEKLTSSDIDGSLTRTTSYERDWRGLATAVTDPAGNVTYDVYDGSGQQVETITPTVSTTTVSTSTGAVTQANGQAVVTVGYDTFGEAVESVDADGNEIRAGYDADGNKIYSQDPTYDRPDPGTGPATVTPVSVYQYDADGELTHSWDPAATGSETVTPGELPLDTASYTAGEETSATYNNLGYAYNETQTDLSGSITTPLTTSATYDALGEQLNTTDPDGVQTISDYDYLGRVTYQTTYERSGGSDDKTAEYDTVAFGYGTTAYQASNPAGYATLQTVQTASTLAVSQSSAATVLSAAYRTYDSAGELASQISPVDTASSSDVAVESYTYDGAGRVVNTSEPNGSSTQTHFDEAGLETSSSTEDGTGAVIASGSSTYDTDGQAITSTTLDQTATQSPTGTATYATSCFTYDATGLLTTEVQPVTAASNPANGCTGYVTSGTGANAIQVSYAYDPSGKQTAYTDGDGNTTYTSYNSLGQAEATIVPAVSTSTYSYTGLADRETVNTYDADGNVTAEQEPGSVTVTSDYDAFGRTSDQNGSVGSGSGSGTTAPTAERSFTYGNDGEILSASTSATSNSAATTESFTYDDRGSLTSATGATGATGDSSFTYTAAGQMASRTDASGTSTYAYADGLLTSDTDAASGTTLQYAYYPTTGQTKSVSYGGSGGDTRTFLYNAAGDVTSDSLTVTATGSNVGLLTYAYNAAGELTSKQDSTGTANAYTYDEAGRLTSWTKGSSTSAYSGSGTCTNGSSLTCYAYDADSNRTEVGSNVYAYDARDELTSDGTNTYTYTANGDVSQISKSTVNGPVVTGYTDDAYGQQQTAGVSTYTYDAAGRMVSETSGTTTSTTQYSGTGNDVAEAGGQTYSRDPSGGLVGENTAGASTAGNVLWTDEHTDVVAAFGASSTTLSGTQEYDPLGNVLTSTGAMQGIELGYQSEFTDKSTGEVNMASRWYNPATGTFLNKDSATNSATPDTANANPFAYGNGDPLVGTDPTGTTKCDINPELCSGKAKTERPQTTPTPPSPPADQTVAQDPNACATKLCHDQVTQQIETVQTVQNNIVDEAYSDLDRECMHGAGAVKCLEAHADQTYSKAIGDTLQETGGQYVENGELITDQTYISNVVGAQEAAAAQAKAAQHRSWWKTAISVATQVITTVATVAAVIACAACAPLVGALASMIDYSVDAALNGNFSVTGMIASGVVGLASAYIGGAASGLASKITSKIASSVLSSALEGAVAGTAAGAVGGFGNYSISCGQSCSLTGALVSTGTGALVGGITGGVGGGALAAAGKAAGSLRSSGDSAAGDATGAADTAAANTGETASGTPDVEAGGSAATDVSEPTGSGSPANGEGDPANDTTGCPSAPNSFTASTPVLMADGTTKAISQVKVGDQIENSIPGQSGVQTNTVTAVEVVQTDHDFVDVTVKPVTPTTPSTQPATASGSTSSTIKIKTAVKRATLGAAAALTAIGLATSAVQAVAPQSTAAGASTSAAALASSSSTSTPTAHDTTSHNTAASAKAMPSGGTITTTFLHPFYDETQTSFVEAQFLHTGDVLQTTDGTAVITALHLYHADTTTYDLTIGSLHTFYVLAGQTPVLVHNTNGCGPVVGLNDPSSEISQVSMSARMANGVKPTQNVAVYRVGEGDGARYLAAANDPGGLHSEEILNNFIKDPANGISPDDVTGVYSERVPCMTDPHNCASSLSQYGNAQDDISWSLNPDGIRNGAKNAGAIARAMGSYSGPPDGLPDFEWITP